MSQFANVAEVLNAYGVAVFPVKNQPGKFTASFINAHGKRQFLDRKQITKADQSTTWAWVVGKELAPREVPAAQTQIQVAA